MSANRGGRPRISLDEEAVVAAYRAGVPILRLAADHGVDRYVIRRILDDNDVARVEHRGAHWAAKRATRGAA